MPAESIEWVNAAQTEVEIEAFRKWLGHPTARKTENTDRGYARIEIHTSAPRQT